MLFLIKSIISNGFVSIKVFDMFVAHSINIAGSMHPVGCSQYTSVCSYEGNLDIRLTFPVTACPQNCTCREWEAKTECSASCGFGTQIMEQRCRGNGCLPPLIRTKMSACRKHVSNKKLCFYTTNTNIFYIVIFFYKLSTF